MYICIYIYAFSGENIFCVNQWQNTANRMAHYLTTGKFEKYAYSRSLLPL